MELFKENMRLDNDIRSIVRNESVLRKTANQKNTIMYELLYFMSAVVSLAIGWFLRGKFR